MKKRRIYFMGIGGTAMGNAALLMRSLGAEVGGVDENVYPPMSDVLREAGITWCEGYAAENLQAFRPDLVVVGNAMTRGNPEVETLLENPEIDRISLPELLGQKLLRYRNTLVVAGTHGKTTTTTLAVRWLQHLGVEPGYLIGGVPLDLPGGWSPGEEGGPFVIEGDEYDSAFFDKRSKFLHYRPRGILLNNLEFDHADIFRDLADIERSFRHLLRVLPASGFVVTNGDDPVLERLFPIEWGRVVRVGEGEGNDIRILDFAEGEDGCEFRLRDATGRESGQLRTPLCGKYNVRNLVMSRLGTDLLMGRELSVLEGWDVMGELRGVKRRQDLLGERSGWIIMEDFGHHPTAIRQTLESVRNRYPGRRVHVSLEPRSNTIRTRHFQRELIEALAVADHISVAPVHRGELLAEEERLDIDRMAAELCELGRVARAYHCWESLERELRAQLEAGEDGESAGGGLLVFFTNGSFEGIPRRLVRAD